MPNHATTVPDTSAYLGRFKMAISSLRAKPYAAESGVAQLRNSAMHSGCRSCLQKDSGTWSQLCIGLDSTCKRQSAANSYSL
jgi:hypothetical protein